MHACKQRESDSRCAAGTHNNANDGVVGPASEVKSLPQLTEGLANPHYYECMNLFFRYCCSILEGTIRKTLMNLHIVY
jgi:hypothetical protein